jgi:hypothetical protein
MRAYTSAHLPRDSLHKSTTLSLTPSRGKCHHCRIETPIRIVTHTLATGYGFQQCQSSYASYDHIESLYSTVEEQRTRRLPINPIDDFTGYSDLIEVEQDILNNAFYLGIVLIRPLP